MMSNGFITDADFAAMNKDSELTDLHIEDLRIGSSTPESDDQIIRVFVENNSSNLYFTYSQAQAAVEAINEILSRYNEPE